MDNLKFAAQVSGLVRKEIKSYADKNATDTTLRISQIEGNLCSGTTPAGKTVRGVSYDGNASVGQQIGAQRGKGSWAARSAVYKSGPA